MITLELSQTNILVTAGFSLASIVVTALITWYFSKRHYLRTRRTVTENDITLERNRLDYGVIALVALLLFFLMFTCMVTDYTIGSDSPANKTVPASQ